MEYLARMAEEKKQLDERLSKLNDFIRGEEFDKLDKINRNSLIEQKAYMTGYQKVLNFRIGINTPTGQG